MTEIRMDLKVQKNAKKIPQKMGDSTWGAM